MPVAGAVLWVECERCNITMRIRMHVTLPMSDLLCPRCDGPVRAATAAEVAETEAHICRRPRA